MMYVYMSRATPDGWAPAEAEFTDVVNKHLLKRKTIDSYAVIAHSIIDGKLYYLVGKARDSIPFKEFIRGNLPWKNPEEVTMYISNMSMEEKYRLLNEDFSDLVDDVIVNHVSRAYRSARENREEFEKNKECYRGPLQDAHNGLPENAWLFPKGRKQEPEMGQACALREFEEETHIPANIVSIYDEFDPLEEIYVGLDGRLYRTIYFVGFIDSRAFTEASKLIRDKFIVTKQRTTLSEEIARIKWLRYPEAAAKLDPTKQYILRLVNTFLIFHLRRPRITRRHSYER